MANDQVDLNDETTFAKEALQCEIGAKLQRAREEKNLSIDDILNELKLRKTFLNALESGNWSDMPGEVYALGFLKQYASLLDLDVSNELDRMKSNSYELNTPLTYPDEPISPNRTWAVSAILLFILTILVVNAIDDTDKPENKKQALKENNAMKIEQPNIAQEDILIDSYSISTPYNNMPLKEKSIMEAAPTLEAPESISVETDLVPSAKKKPLNKNKTTEKRTYTFFAAKGDVWLQVYEKKNEQESLLLREVLLKKGQNFSIIKPSNANILLTAGNAIALEVKIDDKTVYMAGTLGEEGKVLKKQPITP